MELLHRPRRDCVRSDTQNRYVGDNTNVLLRANSSGILSSTFPLILLMPSVLQRAGKPRSFTRSPPPEWSTPSAVPAGTASCRRADVPGVAGPRISSATGSGADAGIISSTATSKCEIAHKPRSYKRSGKDSKANSLPFLFPFFLSPPRGFFFVSSRKRHGEAGETGLRRVFVGNKMLRQREKIRATMFLRAIIFPNSLYLINTV